MSARGIDVVAAVTLVAEIGDFTRFARAQKPMGFLELVPLGVLQRQLAPPGVITKRATATRRMLT